MALLSVAEHRELFSNAGYSDVRMIEKRDKGWICGIGRKPIANSSRRTLFYPRWPSTHHILTSVDRQVRGNMANVSDEKNSPHSSALEFLLQVVSPGKTWRAGAQSEKAPYPVMALLSRYLMGDENSEIALARSA